MKAEIGFVRNWGADGQGDGAVTDRMEMVIRAESQTEGTSLMMFARRLGLRYDEVSGQMTINEPRSAFVYATASGEPLRYHGDDMEVGKPHMLLPPGAVVKTFDRTTGIITYEVI